MKIAKITCRDCGYSNHRAWAEMALIVIGECPACNLEMEPPYPGERIIFLDPREYEGAAKTD